MFFLKIEQQECITKDCLIVFSGSLISIHDNDENPRNFSDADIAEARKRIQSEIGGLALLLRLKIDARVMITENIDIPNRLINGQLGMIKQFKFKQGKVTAI